MSVIVILAEKANAARDIGGSRASGGDPEIRGIEYRASRWFPRERG